MFQDEIPLTPFEYLQFRIIYYILNTFSRFSQISVFSYFSTNNHVETKQMFSTLY